MGPEYDVIIVGAGSAGCAAAWKLATETDLSVLLIESGGTDRDFFVRMPRGIGQMNRPGDRRLWTYEVAKGGNRENETWIKGHIIGGSSSVNGAAYLRGFPSDYDGWSLAGCSGWGWDEMGRCFRMLEDHVLGEGDGRGVGGPLKISVQRGGLEAVDAIFAAAADLGVPVRRDINSPETAREGGIGYQSANIHQGKRVNAGKAFLEPLRHRDNFTLMAETRVSRLIFEGRRVVGVETAGETGPAVIRARREVILSAGAIESPKLLQLSGIGPANVLAAHGIAAVHDAPEVGRNLMEHRYLPVQYRLGRGSSNVQLRGIGLARSLAAYLFAGRGVLTRAVWEATAFVKSRPGLEIPDGQIGIGLYSMRPGGGYSGTKYVVEPEPGLAIGSYQLRPESRGYLEITSSDPRAALRIDANYLATEEDRASAAALTRWIRKVMRQPALAFLEPREISPGNDPAMEDDDIVAAYLSHGNSGYHVAGTCRMGTDQASVVDHRLRVRGVDGLRVIDMSIVPTMPSGNTNGPAMVVGIRGAEMIIEDIRDAETT